ncbi:hypothetical protein [Bacillus thuringiensis]|uniref:hypothetical protein n=1 Tax=Bacillus thuringiensis TaxID=1428 RepID=UPI001F515502|nr:hypothetical protein [Bacillus thuringiensis]
MKINSKKSKREEVKIFVLKFNNYVLTYTIIAPSGERYPSKEINMYTHSLEHAIQIIDNEIQRRLGSGYHSHISCIDTDEHSDYQLALF